MAKRRNNRDSPLNNVLVRAIKGIARLIIKERFEFWDEYAEVLFKALKDAANEDHPAKAAALVGELDYKLQALRSTMRYTTNVNA